MPQTPAGYPLIPTPLLNEILRHLQSVLDITAPQLRRLVVSTPKLLGLSPVDVLQIPFWNNFFLMIVLVWIQTGFAMVILSAAIRGIPEETIEAAIIDGANPFQIFFRIKVPQIMGTIVVVWTTITLVVLKIFLSLKLLIPMAECVQTTPGSLYSRAQSRSCASLSRHLLGASRPWAISG